MSTDMIPSEFSEIAAICAATDVVIGGRVVLGIADARKLHEGLKAETAFKDWMPRRIKALGLVEGIDFEEVSLKNEQNPSGGRPTKDYRLTLDAAKHMAMVEKNEVGRLVRSYFIWVENRAIAAQPSVSVADIERRMMSALGGMVKGILNKQVGSKIAELEQKVDAALTKYDPSGAFVTDHHPIIHAIEEFKVPQKGRRGLSSKCSKLCERWLQATGRGGMIRISRETGRKMFKEAGLKAWLAAEGSSILIAARDKAAGQSILPFPKGGRGKPS